MSTKGVIWCDRHPRDFRRVTETLQGRCGVMIQLGAKICRCNSLRVNRIITLDPPMTQKIDFNTVRSMANRLIIPMLRPSLSMSLALRH